MQPSKKTKTSKPSAGTASSKAAGSGAPAKAVASTKNTKESFQKKLLLIQKNYDYKDESRDVKGKTERLNAINEIQQLL
jgi:hypothetical protein